MKSATDIVRDIRAGTTTAAATMRASLDVIEAREPSLHAFVHLDPEAAMARAEAADRSGQAGPLQGVPFAIKDIFDTDFAPTGWGSPIYSGFHPPRNAASVALMIAAGAVPVGKTVTTEFAFFNPGPTDNPSAPGHTPGGSSSGSAAAVASGMVPLAFGSQTAASVIRPAAFCGVLGYKASLGDLPLEGVMGLSPSLDSLGLLGRHVEDLCLARAVLAGGDGALPDMGDGCVPRIGVMRGPHWWDGTIEMRDVVQGAVDTLASAGAVISELAHPALFAELTDAHATVMAFEAARARADEVAKHPEAISAMFLDLVTKGPSIDRGAYLGALEKRTVAQRLLAPMFLDCDVILAPAALGPPPVGLTATGDPIMSRSWTLLGLPALSVPAGNGPQGVQLLARHGADDLLLGVGKWVADRLSGRADRPDRQDRP